LRVHEEGFAFGLVLGVERVEVFLEHDDFAADFVRPERKI